MTEFERLQNAVDVATAAVFNGTGSIASVRRAQMDFEIYKQTHDVNGKPITKEGDKKCM